MGEADGDGDGMVRRIHGRGVARVLAGHRLFGRAGPRVGDVRERGRGVGRPRIRRSSRLSCPVLAIPR